MHTRQSGAAHVPIMFFILVLVLFLGAVGWAYSVANTNAEQVQALANAKADMQTMAGKQLLFTHYIEDLGRVIELPGKYEGRGTVYSGATLDGVTGVISPADLKKRMDSFSKALGLSDAKGIEGLCSAAVALVNDKLQREKDIGGERDMALADKVAVEKSFGEATSEHTKKASEWSQALEQAKAEYTASLSQKDTNISALTSSVRDTNDQLNVAKEAAAAEKKVLSNDIGKLKMHNSALTSKDKLRSPMAVVDGKIIVAKAGVTAAFINLGRKDMLQPGTIFRVLNKNSTVVKAYATVVRVEQDKAEVTLSEVRDPLTDAVREGDELYNELFSANGANKRTIYLMGRFSYPYNKDQLAMLLKNLGNTVVQKMGPGVDTVLLGDDAINEAGDGFTSIADSQEYKEANALGVEFAPLRKIRDLLKL